MKCLTDEQIQRWIDNEIDDSERTALGNHLAICENCQQSLNERHEQVKLFRSLMQPNAPVAIPPFQIPATTHSKPGRRFHFPVWARVAAVLIPAWFVAKFAFNKPEEFRPTPQQIIMQETCHDIDANSAFQQNMMVTTVTDENGNVLECSTR